MPAEIDIGNADELRRDLVAAIDQGFAIVIADLSDTQFCDCAAVNALLTSAHYAATVGGDLRVVASARPVLRTFELTELTRLLAVYPDVESALAGPVLGRARPTSIRGVTELSSRRQIDRRERDPQRRQRRSP